MAAGKPSLEQAYLLVDRGKDPAGDQELPDVLDGPPRPEVAECLVGQVYVPAGEAPQQDFGIAGLPLRAQSQFRPGSGLSIARRESASGQSRYRGSAATCEIFGFIAGSLLVSVPVLRAGCRRGMMLD